MRNTNIYREDTTVATSRLYKNLSASARQYTIESCKFLIKIIPEIVIIKIISLNQLSIIESSSLDRNVRATTYIFYFYHRV